jgi:hypothetical protein
LLDGFIYCRAPYRQFLDSQLGRSDDLVVRVLVLLEAEGLSAERVLDFLAFALEPSKFAVVLVPVARDGLGEVELQQAKAIRAERDRRAAWLRGGRRATRRVCRPRPGPPWPGG